MANAERERPRHSSRTQMPLRYFVCLVAAAALIGCSSKSRTPIGGPYYLDSTRYASVMSESGGYEVHLTYKKGWQTILISKNPGGNGGSIYNNFSWRVYGSNLIFVEHDPGSLSFRLVAFSEKKKQNITIDKDFHYWKIIADDTGIICHRYQNGDTYDDPDPKVFSADYLKGL